MRSGGGCPPEVTRVDTGSATDETGAQDIPESEDIVTAPQPDPFQPGAQPGPAQPGTAPQPDWGSPQSYRGAERPTDPAAGTDDRLIAVLAHLSPVIAAIASAGALSWLGPLILWLVYKDRNALVRNASATSFNFHITVWIAYVVGWIMVFTLVLLPVGVVLIALPWLAQIIFSIIGAVRAWNGELYRYPFQIPILRG